MKFRSSWRTHWWRKAIVFALAVALLLTSLAVYDELGGNSTLQAHNFHRLSREAGFHVAPGRSPSIRFPATGPLDQRLGYVELPRFIDRLDTQGCSVASQARWSPRLSNLADWGLFPPYREATQTGLQIRDRHGTTISAMQYPERVFQRFEDIPWLIVDTLLFIENRKLFDEEHPKRNPAIEIDRLARAALDRGARLLDPAHRATGGSTLATQMEKFRHSHEGRTESVGEKLRQILSASMRSYQHGEDTQARRKEIVLDYLNAVPLGGRPPWGEVLGLGDALWVWYGRDFAETIRLLRTAGDDEEEIAARGATYKAVLSLLIALRRPSGLLGANSDRLEILTERYLRLLADARIIDGKLRDAALGSRLAFSRNAPTVPQESLASRKGIDAVRAQLATLLGAHRRYDVDRMDLAIDTTLDQETEDAVRRALRTFANPVQARAAGLVGERLLARGDPAKVVYSVTLYEVRDAAFRLLVQTDSTDQPFDVNEGLKLDLGSTAKLRTLVTYLELVASLHARLADHDRETLRATRIDPDDALLRWAVDHLLHAKDRSRTAMLEAAMERRYAANAAEAFFTGGGLHTFQNFRVEDDVRVVSVAEAFRESINLVFVRLLRDIALHHTHAAGAGVRDHPRHAETLARFADYEGRVFIERFYRKYRGMTADDIETALMQRGNRTAPRAAVVFRSIAPQASFDEFTSFVDQWTAHGSIAPPRRPRDDDSLFVNHGPGRMSLADRGFVAGIHPLELAVAAVLRNDPGKTFAQVALETDRARQDAYAWLFSGKNQAAQRRALGTMLERDAFAHIHRGWQQVGYPFDAVVPSLASALGASADRPTALAELIGIILADGFRLPIARVERLRFAQGTPYETAVKCHPRPAERVMDAAVAAVLRKALLDVVNRGTAVRARGLFAHLGDDPLVIGGKTGTGDHRHKTFYPGGALREERTVNRAAAFVFFLGEDLFGTVTAYVTGAGAAEYQFTSALPVQVLKTLEPVLRPLVAARQRERNERRNVPSAPESNDLASR